MHCTSNVPIQSAESLFCLQVKRIYSHIDLKTFHDNTCHRVLPLLHNKLLRLLGYHTFRGTQFGRLSLPFKQLSGLMFPIPASLTHHLGQPQARAFRFCRGTDQQDESWKTSVGRYIFLHFSAVDMNGWSHGMGTRAMPPRLSLSPYTFGQGDADCSQPPSILFSSSPPDSFSSISTTFRRGHECTLMPLLPPGGRLFLWDG